jgi:hypothetical protein
MSEHHDAGSGSTEHKARLEQTSSEPESHPRGGDAATLRDLRRVRREIRLGDTEWFDVLYRVYLFALVGSVVVVVASDAIGGLIDDGVSTTQILQRGPSIAGVVVAIAFGIGLRNGADGGPVSIEAADIRHVLLSPISRRRVLLRPIVQRVRSVAFAFGLVLAILGQLVAREIDGSRAAWAASGAMFGAFVAVIYVGTAVIAHAIRVTPAVASIVAGGGVVWQAVVAWRIWHDDASGLGRVGPTNLAGSLLFWGVRSRTIDALALAFALVLVAVAMFLGGRLRLEPLERRGQLVSQLRFAATVQDIRTVVLLRRQLRAESMRSRPWFARTPISRASSLPRPTRLPVHQSQDLDPRVVWRRGANALRRLPIGRMARIVILAAAAGVAAAASLTWSPLLLIGFVIAVFLVGLESLEPLAQEIDRPDLTDAMPVDRGWLYANHLVAPAGLLAVAGLIGAAAAVVVRPDDVVGAIALGIPLAWTGAIGAVVTTVRDAPEPSAVASTTLVGADRGTESPFTLPEFAGAGNAITGAMPIVLSAIAALPILALRVESNASNVLRSVIGVALCLAMMTFWILRRDRWAIKIRAFFVAGRAESGFSGGTRT